MKKVKKDGKRKKPAAVKGPDFVKLLGANLSDPVSRAAVNRAEDLYSDLTSQKKKGAKRGFTLPPADQLAALIALIMGFLTPKPQPAPVPVPTPTPGPGPTRQRLLRFLLRQGIASSEARRRSRA